MSSSSDERGPVGVLADEFLARCKRGERPTIKEYCDRHPALAGEIRDVFEALLMVEDLRPGTDEVSGSDGESVKVTDKRLERVGDYRILCEIGRGGMGVVFEAEQSALGRRVALKVLPRSSAGDGSAQVRFQREAKAAARMHHTNIVPVFDVGQDGEHLYYAMQLIHGQGLDLVIDDLKRLRAQSGATPAVSDRAAERSIAASLAAGRFQRENLAPEEEADSQATATYQGSAPSSAVLPGQSELSTATSNRRAYFRSVAQIGVQTASALSYAHGRGIIHRDIKPGNLILDTTGNVWVTDFGLAKTGDGGLTHTGDILGTVRYMSPERFRGQCDVRADVYALGMTLYELLTLQAAYASGDRLKLIELIRQSEATSPRSVDGQIPRDLETIVMKAIDKDAKRRYQSADEMAEDLQRFVNDEPIKARRIGSLERLGRWCRRNPAVAVLLTAVLVLMAAGTAVSSWQAVSANLARVELAAKNAELTDEQAKVEERFQMAQRAIALFHTGVSEDMLLKNPQFEELRTKLLKEAAGFYADLEKLLAGQTDAKSRKTLADGYFRLAELTAKIGDKKEALAVHRQGLAVRRELAASPGADVETRLDVARSLGAVGGSLKETGDPAGAMRAWEEMRDIATGLESEAPSEVVRAVLAASHHNIGWLLWGAGQYDEALRATRQALSIRQRLAHADSAYTRNQQSLTVTYSNLGGILSEMGSPEEALEMIGQALAIRQRLSDADPADTQLQADLAQSYRDIGWLHYRSATPARAMEPYGKALAIRQKLADAQPAVTEYQRQLGIVYINLGTVLARTGRLVDGMEAHRKARALIQRLADANPLVVYLQEDLANISNELGWALARAGHSAEALKEYSTAVTLFQRLADAAPMTLSYTSGLGYSHAERGWTRMRAGQPKEAADDLRRAVALWAKIPFPDPEFRFERSRTFALLAGLGAHPNSGVAPGTAMQFADQAMEALRGAVAAGWSRPVELKEPDFDALRGRADFQKLVAEVEAKAEKPLAATPLPREKK
jgi:serine/threonine-protein kinase